jgi:hypothetical protein
MKRLVLLSITTIAGCGGYFSDDPKPEELPQAIVIIPPTASIETNFPVQPVAEIPVVRPAPEVSTPPAVIDTGSSNVTLAQTTTYQTPEFLYDPTLVKLRGESAEVQLALKNFPEPPHELSPCYNGFVLMPVHQPISKDYQYNGWWLLASVMGVNRPLMPDTTHFYWTTQISDTQVGAIPAEYSVRFPLPDAQLDLGFAQLPYQLANRLEFQGGLPLNPDERCEK